MNLVEVLLLLVVAAICGSLGQTIAGFSRGGCLVSIVLGFIGAILGLWLKRQFNLPEPFILQIGGNQFPVLWSIIGCALFVSILGLASRGTRT